MLFHLIAMFVAGVGAAGLVLALRRISGRRIAAWLVPAAAGAAMLAFTVWSEYTWYPRTSKALGPGLQVVLAPPEAQVWRPWTYAFPIVTRFVAMDLRAAPAGGAAAPFVADALIFNRWVPPAKVPIAFDCAADRLARLEGGAALTGQGELTGTDWIAAVADDPLYVAACKRG